MATGERDTCHTNQLCAIFCMKSPELDTIAPIMSRRKFRWRSERSVLKDDSLGMTMDKPRRRQIHCYANCFNNAKHPALSVDSYRRRS
jgi:hypothetical protein